MSGHTAHFFLVCHFPKNEFLHLIIRKVRFSLFSCINLKEYFRRITRYYLVIFQFMDVIYSIDDSHFFIAFFHVFDKTDKLVKPFKG